jgi:hypothetical protein
MREDGRIDYVEFPAARMGPIKAFYGEAFGWNFQDWGPDYIAFDGAGIDGGFGAESTGATAKPLVILYANDLEAMEARVRAAGGVITRAIFAFPGGRRFHFRDPAGNELGVWTQDGAA